MAFKQATRKKSKLRLAIDGPTGSGKTLTALRMAMELARHEAGKSNRTPRVAVIDTEFGTASKYEGDIHDGHPISFDVDDLASHSPTSYTNAVNLAARLGYDVVVIDSLSHAWNGTDGALALVDKKSSGGGNPYTAWKDVTPLQNQMVDSIIRCPIHVISTMRSKMEYVLEVNEKGKSVPRKIGLAPIQRQGIEYEFDILMDMDLEHVATVAKSRCSPIDGKVIQKPGADLMQTIIQWLENGSDISPEDLMAAGIQDAVEPATTGTATNSPAAVSIEDQAARMAAKRAAMQQAQSGQSPPAVNQDAPKNANPSPLVEKQVATATASTTEANNASAATTVKPSPATAAAAIGGDASPTPTVTLTPDMQEIAKLFDLLGVPEANRVQSIKKRGAETLDKLSPEGAANLLAGLQALQAGKVPPLPNKTPAAGQQAAAAAASPEPSTATTASSPSPLVDQAKPAMITGAQIDRINDLFKRLQVPSEAKVKAYQKRGVAALPDLTADAANELIANLIGKLPPDEQLHEQFLATSPTASKASADTTAPFDSRPTASTAT